MLKKYRYDGSKEFKLSKTSTNETSLESDRAKAEEKMMKNVEKMQELQSKLYADKKEGLILLFQAMDAAGKDGTISSRPPRRSWPMIICGGLNSRCR